MTESQHARRWLILAAVALAQLMIVLDVTVVNIALPSAQADLSFGDNSRQWVISAYALAFGSLLLLGGRISDLVGRKRAFVIGLLGFAGASAAAGATPSFELLVAARALQGSFAALLAPTVLSILTTTFTDPQERATAFGFSATTSSSWSKRPSKLRCSKRRKRALSAGGADVSRAASLARLGYAFLARTSSIVAPRHQQVESEKHGRECRALGDGADHAAVESVTGFARQRRARHPEARPARSRNSPSRPNRYRNPTRAADSATGHVVVRTTAIVRSSNRSTSGGRRGGGSPRRSPRHREPAGTSTARAPDADPRRITWVAP